MSSVHPARILVVDDFAPWRDQLRSLLKRHPEWEIIGEACDGREAIEKATEMQPDIILLDVGMPSLNGIEVAKSSQLRYVIPRQPHRQPSLDNPSRQEFSARHLESQTAPYHNSYKPKSLGKPKQWEYQDLSFPENGCSSQQETHIDWLIGIADTTGKTWLSLADHQAAGCSPSENVAILYALRSRTEIVQNHYDRMRREPLRLELLELSLLLVEKSRLRSSTHKKAKEKRKVVKSPDFVHCRTRVTRIHS